MNCGEIQQLVVDYLSGNLATEARTKFEKHTAECESCRAELERLNAVWHAFAHVPEEAPSAEMSARFYAMLEAYKQGMQQSPSKRSLRARIAGILENWWPKKPAVQFALSLCLLMSGVLIGGVSNMRILGGGEMAKLRMEMTEMRQMFTISLLNQSSSSERLRGVSICSQIKKPSATLLETLVSALDTDENVNVRLAAVDALYLFSDLPDVRTALVRSMSRQTSPMVQVALIDLLVHIKEQRALDALRELIINNNIHPIVKDRAELGLQQII